MAAKSASPLRAGEEIVILYEQTNRYYRGKVISIEDSVVKVNYVGYSEQAVT